MISEQVSTTGLAPFAKAIGRLVVGPDIIRALGNLQRLRIPQHKGIHGASRPVTAGLAMAIPHGRRLAADRKFDRSAETLSFVVAHILPLSLNFIFILVQKFTSRRRDKSNSSQRDKRRA